MAQLNIVGVEDAIKSILDTANTTTATPVDLSANMDTNRVKNVFTLNPASIPMHGAKFPLISVWCESKTVENRTIAKNLATGSRRAELSIKIFGFSSSNNYDDLTKDTADRDVKYMMENVEEILRTSPDMSATLNSHRVEDANYFNIADGEETIFKCAVLTLSGWKYY